MFRGSLPSSVFSMMHEVAKGWPCSDVYIPCSGNFTIERELNSPGFPKRFRLHSCDVTIYSSSVGYFLSGGSPPTKVRPEWHDHYGWLEEWMQTPADAMATIMLSTRLLEGLGKSDNPFYSRMERGYKSQWPELHKKSKKRVEAAAQQCPLAEFHCGDAVDWIDTAPMDAGTISFPPFYAGAFEADFKRVAKVFDWTPPDYPILTDERKQLMLQRMAARDHWLFAVHQRLEAYEPFLIGMAQTTNRGVPIFVYSNSGKSRIVRPAQAIEQVMYPRLRKGQEVGTQMQLRRLTFGEFASLRSQYMNINIRPGNPTQQVGVFVDGILIGVYALSPPKAGIALGDGQPYVYLLSDFPVEPVDYDKLAKLVLTAALSHEAQSIAEEMTKRRVSNLFTTAFSKNPVSMKYRGLFKLYSRAEIDPNDPINYSGGKYVLNYMGEMGRWSLQEGLARWKQKFGTKGHRKEGE